MTMESSDLLPALRELPRGESRQRMSFREIVTGLVNTDRTMHAAEFASAASIGMWAVFDAANVDDVLTNAYEAQYTRLSEDQSLFEYSQQQLEAGPDAWEHFIDQFKGKVAEFEAQDLLEANGYSNVAIAASPNQPVWDISAIDESGQEVFFQVKTGIADYAGDVASAMEANPDIHFLVSTEIYNKISETTPELINQLTDIGSTVGLEDSVEEGLSILSDNMGLDIPDGVVDVLPETVAIIAGVRLICNILETEKEFSAADRTTKNKIQVVQTLTLMSRMGIPKVLAMAFGSGGTAMGGPVAGVIAAGGGVAMGMYLNKHLQPHMLELALDITGLTRDDLFYYKNKPRIDEIGLSFQARARELAAAPSF